MLGWNPHMAQYAVVAAGLTVSWLVYTVLLWLMIKIQRLNYSLRGLLVSSAIAVAVNQIPVVGVYLSAAVLLLCIRKVTGADMVPDVVFTVVIAGALMFCVDLWVLGAVMGRLRPDLETAAAEAPSTVVTNQPAAPPRKATPPPAPSKRNYDHLGLSVRGIMLHQARPAAMITWARGIIQLSPGETCSLETRDGYALIRCDSVTERAVFLTLGGQDKLTLTLR